MKGLVYCLNLDTVKNKNIYQFEAMANLGFTYRCFGYLNNKAIIKSNNYKYIKYPTGFFKRIFTVFREIAANKGNINHIELYTGCGNFLIVEFFIAKLLGIKVCVVERGSPLRNINSHYGKFSNFFRKYIYKNATQVWIRELWMRNALVKLGRVDYFFQSNAIELSKSFCHGSRKDIDFIWCNSLIKFRNVEWFIGAVSRKRFHGLNNVLLGMLDNNKTVELQQEYVRSNKPNNTELLCFQDPSPYFIRSKFFVLPADIVYLNFALLEAMSFGVVPIVSNVEGVSEIITDGVDGIIAEHSKDGIEHAIEKAINLSDEEYEILSINARKKIEKKFSMKKWAMNLQRLYIEI